MNDWLSRSLWQPGELGFSDPIDTQNGYFVTEATLRQEDQALQVFIRCRDRKVLDDYISALKIEYKIEPGDSPGSDSEKAQPRVEMELGTPGAQESSASSDGEPDMHIYIALIETKVEQGTMQLHIDPPLKGNKKHRYHLPKARSAQVTVATVSGRIHAEFSLKPQPVDINHGQNNKFDAPEGSDANVKLQLTGMQSDNMYQITGAFIRVAQEAAKKPDDLFEGEN